MANVTIPRLRWIRMLRLVCATPRHATRQIVAGARIRLAAVAAAAGQPDNRGMTGNAAPDIRGSCSRRSCLRMLVAMAGCAGWEDAVAESGDRRAAARRLETALIAPCCFQQTVADHHSPMADRIRAEISERLAGGMTEQGILDGFVAKYGERILSAPTRRGFNLLAYAVPPAALFAASAALIVALRRSAARSEVLAAEPNRDPSARDRLDAALRAFDAD